MDEHRTSMETSNVAGSNRIVRLPPEMVERIAAGEVIERPASVVRELIDNALDAGARAIRIELRHGGLRLIRVADDGCGIAPDDLPLACAPHATSKVTTLADLDHIATLGFRGEALASVAAVAELEIASATEGSGVAQVITAGPERPPMTSATSRPRGTTVTVRDLFATVPARQALLRGSRTEAGRIAALVRAYALIHPNTRFLLLSDGHLILQTHGNPAFSSEQARSGSARSASLGETVSEGRTGGNSSLHAAIADLYGPDVERALLSIGPLEIQSSRLAGVVASHAFSHPTRDHVVLAINGRPVHNRTLLAALEAGYRPLLRKGRHPVLVAHITTAPERLDANIHPTKFEVLLKDEALIAPALREAVHRALGSVPRGALLSAHASALPHNPPVQLRLPLPRKRRGLLLGERQHQYAVPSRFDGMEEALESIPALESLAQFDDTLILARAADGHLYLVDQHRAHERVLYEQLLRLRAAIARSPGTRGDEPDDAEVQGANTTCQLLLEPVLVELTPRQAEQLEPRLHELSALGLDCQPFGGSVFLVRSVPDIAGAAQGMGPLPTTPAAFARALAEDAAVDSDGWLDYLCVSLACRSAIRRGQSLDSRQRQSLLDGLQHVAAPAVCPHGSPLIVRFTRSYLTRAFEW